MPNSISQKYKTVNFFKVLHHIGFIDTNFNSQATQIESFSRCSPTTKTTTPKQPDKDEKFPRFLKFRYLRIESESVLNEIKIRALTHFTHSSWSLNEKGGPGLFTWSKWQTADKIAHLLSDESVTEARTELFLCFRRE